MYPQEVCESLMFQLRNIALFTFEEEAEYKDITSPYYRLYLIHEGYGTLQIGPDKVTLEPGYIYLVPSFVLCTYRFGRNLSHTYIHFNIQHPINNGLNHFYSYRFVRKASDFDKILFDRLLVDNPNLQLPHHHPNVYQKKPWINKKVVYRDAAHHYQTVGILCQLYSRFLICESTTKVNGYLKYNLQPILDYIHENLENEILSDDLANIACLSKDHFSKVFKTILGVSPHEYIIRKRIEKAQYLLLTTELALNEITEKTNIKSLSYFCRLFKKITRLSPAEYRKQHQHSI